MSEFVDNNGKWVHESGECDKLASGFMAIPSGLVEIHISKLHARINELTTQCSLDQEENINLKLSNEGNVKRIEDLKRQIATVRVDIMREAKARIIELDNIKKLVGYPEEWDAAAYPTLESAIIECMQ